MKLNQSEKYVKKVRSFRTALFAFLFGMIITIGIYQISPEPPKMIQFKGEIKDVIVVNDSLPCIIDYAQIDNTLWIFVNPE